MPDKRSKRQRKYYKDVERRIAKLLGGERNPLSGRNSKHCAGDVIHPKYLVEVKYREKNPSLNQILGWLNEAVENAKKENKIPLLILVLKGKKKPILITYLRDVLDILKGDE